MYYVGSMPVYNGDLIHSGVLGMKWGIRRTPEELGYKPIKGKYGDSVQRRLALHTDTTMDEREKKEKGFSDFKKKHGYENEGSKVRFYHKKKYQSFLDEIASEKRLEENLRHYQYIYSKASKKTKKYMKFVLKNYGDSVLSEAFENYDDYFLSTPNPKKKGRWRD